MPPGALWALWKKYPTLESKIPFALLKFLSGLPPLERGTPNQPDVGLPPLERGANKSGGSALPPLERGTDGASLRILPQLGRGTTLPTTYQKTESPSVRTKGNQFTRSETSNQINKNGPLGS